MSESIKAGYIPWWNPYVNFGIPQYADMSSGFWSPITWFIAATVGYNVYTITLELLFYILMGGFGMYKLGNLWQWRQTQRILAAVSYMSSGFVVGHLQHLNWIAAVGLLPWCIWSFYKLIQENKKATWALSLLLFYFFISTSHPGMIIGGIYFFAFLFFHFAISKKYPKETENRNSYLRRILLFILLLCLFSAGIIVSYVEILPFITRSEKPLIDINTHTTNIKNWLSFLFPSIVLKQENNINDITLRNCYVGITMLAGLIASFKQWNKNFIWLFTGFLFLILSANTDFIHKIRSLLPLLSYVRIPGEFRIFGIFSFIIAGTNGLSNVFKKNEPIQYKLNKNVRLILMAWTLLFFLLFILLYYINFSSWKTPTIDFFKSLREDLKLIIKKEHLNTLILGHLILWISLIVGMWQAYRHKKYLLLLALSIIDLFIATQIQIPFTGVGMKTPREIQTMLHKSPKGIPIPDNKPFANYDYRDEEITSTIGHWSLYNKQPGTVKMVTYPIVFKSEDKLFPNQDSFIDPMALFIQTMHGPEKTPVEKSYQDLSILEFNPNKIVFKLKNKADSLIVRYKYYPHWQVTYPKQATIKASNEDFIKISNIEDNRIIEVKFKPSIIILLLTYTGITFFILIGFLFRNEIY